MEKVLEDNLPKLQLNSEDGPSPSTDVEYNANSFRTNANQADVVGTGSYGVVRRCYHDLLKNIVVKCMHCGGSSSATATSIDEARIKFVFSLDFNIPTSFKLLV